MGFMDTLLGRSKAVPPNLDQLFALPAAAVTLQVASDLQPTGTGSVSGPWRRWPGLRPVSSSSE